MRSHLPKAVIVPPSAIAARSVPWYHPERVDGGTPALAGYRPAQPASGGTHTMADRKQALIESVETARWEVLEATAGFTAEQWSRASANEGWSAKDTLAHLSSIEGR